MRFAIIDIGTNTINLAIAAVNDKGTNYQIIYSSKEPAKLGKGGINDCMITPEAMERGFSAIQTHMETIKQFNVDRITAIGTSMMRVAKNAPELIDRIKCELGLDVRLIDGNEEAEMVYDGVKQVIPIGRERVMILDIGGGSCEFVIANDKGIIWKRSFELGMARLYDKFKPGDPIDPATIKQTENYLRTNLTELFEAQRNWPTNTLIGTSGSFDTIAAVIAAKKHPSFNAKLATQYEIDLPNFKELYGRLIASTIAQRAQWPKMDKSRLELVVIGAIFINVVIREMRIERMIQCNYALKQGAIYQLVEEYVKKK